VVLDAAPVPGLVVVGAALLNAQRRREALGVEVAHLDGVAAGPQGGDGGVALRGREAVWLRVDVVEVVGAEVGEGDGAPRHVEGGDQDLVRDGHGRLLGAQARPQPVVLVAQVSCPWSGRRTPRR
jgi:hypothetical protein